MRNFFYMQKNDRRTIVVVLAVLAAALGVMLYVGTDGGLAEVSDAALGARDTCMRRGRAGGSGSFYHAGRQRAELFEFDPNTADSTQLLRLGLAPWQVRSIYKYRAKGGVYRRPSDFARLYGLTAGQYRALEPYIRISADYRPASEVYASGNDALTFRDTLRYPVKIKPGEHVALNTADTAALKTVPGIGSAFARAIVRYRDRLGGFYSVEQLREIDGFPDEALTYFEVRGEALRKINVNKLTLSQLRRHPYIGFWQAKTITDHRRTHGPLRSFGELGMYKDFPQAAIDRLRHYVEF